MAITNLTLQLFADPLMVGLFPNHHSLDPAECGMFHMHTGTYGF